jgi:DNA invertase Pin-like site-specific DNA recombinase
MKPIPQSLPIAFSYIRFSHPDQAKGDSLRRQTDAATEWCSRNGVQLDTAMTFRDLGRSAYTGQHRCNPDRHALAAFLKLVEADKVPRGSYLIIENLDRLSREHIQPALLLALNLLQAGIRIVQLKPAEMVFDDKSDTLPVMMMMMELSRGHGESALKSERLTAAWAQKKVRARKSGDILTRRLPAWVEESGGRLRLIPERAAAVKRVFQLAAAGYGQMAIVKRLVEEGVAPFGDSKQWVKSYVAKILGDRRAVGELQPHNKRDRKSDGPPIPDYYPAVVTDEEWHAARAGAAQRRKTPGRIGKDVNVFAGLIHGALDGDTYFSMTRSRLDLRHRGQTRRVLINRKSAEGLAPALTFPFAPFESGVLSLLAEVDPREITGRDTGADEVMALSGELAQVEAKIAELEAELLNGEVAALAKVLREREARKRELVSLLAEARQKAAHPLSEAWGEAHSLLAAIDNAQDPLDARLRLRSALRRVVRDIRLLVVPRGLDRLAAVQVWFVGDCHRDYFIFHRPARANGKTTKVRTEEKWWAKSLAEVMAPGDLDLRRPDDARLLQQALATVELPAGKAQ